MVECDCVPLSMPPSFSPPVTAVRREPTARQKSSKVPAVVPQRDVAGWAEQQRLLAKEPWLASAPAAASPLAAAGGAAGSRQVWGVTVVTPNGTSRELAVTIAADGRPMALRTQWRDFGFFGADTTDAIVTSTVERFRKLARCISSRFNRAQPLLYLWLFGTCRFDLHALADSFPAPL